MVFSKKNRGVIHFFLVIFLVQHIHAIQTLGIENGTDIIATDFQVRLKDGSMVSQKLFNHAQRALGRYIRCKNILNYHQFFEGMTVKGRKLTSLDYLLSRAVRLIGEQEKFDEAAWAQVNKVIDAATNRTEDNLEIVDPTGIWDAFTQDTL